MNLVVALPFFFDCGIGNLFNEPQEPLPNNGEWRTDTYLFVADAMHCGSLAGAGRAHDLAGDVDDLREARPWEVGVMGLSCCKLHNTNVNVGMSLCKNVFQLNGRAFYPDLVRHSATLVPVVSKSK